MNRKVDIEQLNNLTSHIKSILDKKFEIFSSQIRLSVILILYNYKKIKVTELQHAFNITSGKLEHHLKILENENLLEKKIDLFNKRIYSIVKITTKGEDMLLEYLDIMKDVLKKVERRD